MISIQQIKDICNNTNFKKLKLPQSKLYTQPTYIEKKLHLCNKLKDELQQLNGNILNTSLNNEIITSRLEVQNNTEVIQNLEKSFGDFQMSNNANLIAPDLLNQRILQSEEADGGIIDYDNILNYAENEKLQLFGDIQDLFMNSGILTDNNIELNDCYFYGFKNPDSFIKSVMLLDNPTFIIKNKYDIHNDVSSYKNEFSMHFEDLFTQNYYKLFPLYNKSYKVCRREFIRKEIFNNDEIIQAYCDKTSSNIIVFIVEKSKVSFKAFVANILKKGIHLNNNTLNNITWNKVLLSYRSCYIPLIIPKTGNKLKPSLFIMCNKKFEFVNKSLYNYDMEQMIVLMEKIDKDTEQMKNSANLNKTINTPVLMVVQNNDKRLHQLRLSKRKELHNYEAVMDFTEIDKLKEAELEENNLEEDNNLEEENNLEDNNNLEEENNLEEDNKLKPVKSSNIEKPELNKITSYKLQDLQNLMAKYGLTTQKQAANGKMKNKTKQECYDELLAL